jgi:hypothetical protein
MPAEDLRGEQERINERLRERVQKREIKYGREE